MTEFILWLHFFSQLTKHPPFSHLFIFSLNSLQSSIHLNFNLENCFSSSQPPIHIKHSRFCAPLFNSFSTCWQNYSHAAAQWWWKYFDVTRRNILRSTENIWWHGEVSQRERWPDPDICELHSASHCIVMRLSLIRWEWHCVTWSAVGRWSETWMADHEHERVADPPPTTDSSVNYVKKRCRHRKQEIYQNYFNN